MNKYVFDLSYHNSCRLNSFYRHAVSTFMLFRVVSIISIIPGVRKK